MNQPRPGRPPLRRPQTLRSAEAFARYSARHRRHAPCAEATQIAEAIARKHCAGRRGCIRGRSLLEALRREPDPRCEASRAIDWMLGSISVPECMKLVVLCGVRHEELARALRARPQQRQALVRYLNQFAIEEGVASPPEELRRGRGWSPTL